MAQVINIAEIKKIDTRTKHLLYGFIHNTQTLLPTNNAYYNIPDLIVHLCLMFYYIKECWDPIWCIDIGNFIVNKNEITKKKSLMGYKSAFLSQIVSKGIHHWRFKIIIRGGGNNIDIGICKTSKVNSENANAYFTKTPGDGYAYICTQGSLNGYGKQKPLLPLCKQNDIIDMFVDLNTYQISYAINHGLKVLAFANIAKDEYRAAISMCNLEDTIQLLLYEQL